ncbi:MAG TPA: O-antigen ligase family protein [Gemmatimonadaceae bacterium]|jgi:O-antigen ligase
MAASSVRDRAALVLLQIGAVAVVLAASPYKQFDLDRYFVPKELVLHVVAATTAILLVARRSELMVSLVDRLLAGFLIAGVISAAFATNVWVAERALAISVSGVLLFWVASALRRAGMERALITALALGVVVCAATSLAQAYGIETEYFSLNRAPGGTLGNRNFIAHLCAIGLPVVVLVALTSASAMGRTFGSVAIAMLSAALVMSRSRGAWLAVLVSLVPVALLGVVTWKRWCDAGTLRRLMVLGISAGVGVAIAILLPNRLEWKSENPYLESATGLVNYKEGSGAGRLVQYSNSLKIALAHPILGVGPGNWPVAYPKFASKNDPSMSTSEEGLTSNPWPSSDWMAYLAERGVVGFALLLLAMVMLALRAVRDVWRSSTRDAGRVLTAIALVGTLVATAVVGAFDAVLLIAVPTYFVWTLAGALAPPAEGGSTLQGVVSDFGAVIVFGLGVITVGRSVGQFAAIGFFSTSTKTAAWSHAATYDPGNYRIHTRLGQAYVARGDCTHARPQSRAARALFPNAAEPKRQLSACGAK